jgi:hypothetical protein
MWLLAQGTPSVFPTNLWELTAHYGFPALLVMFLLWVWNKRDDRHSTYVENTERYIREQMLGAIESNVKALQQVSDGLVKFKEEQSQLHELAQSIDKLIVVMGQYTCPFQNGDVRRVMESVK